jgi:hypothetical protein
VTPTNFSFDPRVLYDAQSGHFFAAAADNSGNANRFLVAVSKTNDPTAGWNAFAFKANPTTNLFADFPTLGVNKDGVFLTANDFNAAGNFTGDTVAVLPKANLIGGAPTVSKIFENISAVTNGSTIQPTVNLDGGGQPEPLIGNLGVTPLVRGNVLGPIGAPTLDPAPVNIALSSFLGPVPARQPPPGSTPLNTGDARISANAVLANGSIWSTQTVQDPTTGLDDIRWARINATTNAVIQQGLISDPTFNYFYPSISVDPNNDVVIGFSGSRQGATITPAPLVLNSLLPQFGLIQPNPVTAVSSDPLADVGPAPSSDDITINQLGIGPLDFALSDATEAGPFPFLWFRIPNANWLFQAFFVGAGDGIAFLNVGGNADILFGSDLLDGPEGTVPPEMLALIPADVTDIPITENADGSLNIPDMPQLAFISEPTSWGVLAAALLCLLGLSRSTRSQRMPC